MWKRKFQEVNHDYNEAQEKLMNVEIELEALKKEKARVLINKYTRQPLQLQQLQDQQ